MRASPTEIRLNPVDIAEARRRMSQREADNPAPAYVSSKMKAMKTLGRPVTWAWIWGVLIPAGLAFAAWKAAQTAMPTREMVEWLVALATSVGAAFFSMMLGFLTAGTFFRRRHTFLAVLVLVLFLTSGIMVSVTANRILPSPIAEKSKVVLSTIGSLKKSSTTGGSGKVE